MGIADRYRFLIFCVLNDAKKGRRGDAGTRGKILEHGEWGVGSREWGLLTGIGF
ncbi:MAG: hypothetical protein KME21_01550 [Desmonostoc vinosum HA7617-LM4]|nr:hypothetical protein [Desmonostoc vinosum HA7617-LM4]